MRFLTTLIVIFGTLTISAQYSEDVQPNHSIGLSVKPNVFRSFFDGAPLLELEYRTNLRRENRFRLSLLAGIQDGEYGAAIGWERLLFSSNIIKLYTGIDFSYISYSNDFLRSFGIDDTESSDFNLNIYGGVSYSVSPRFDFFLEPNIMRLNTFTSNQKNTDIGWNGVRFLNTSKFGVRMKF